MTRERAVPRVLIAKPGLDGHDRGAKIVAKALANAGMEVVYTGLRQSVDQIVAAAVQEGVDAVGLSVLSGTHLPLCRKLMRRLAEEGLQGDIQVVVGGNIPRRDVARLEELGVSRVFPTDSRLADIVGYFRDHAAGERS